MAISYVGGKVAGTAGQGGGSITLTSGWTGGSGGNPLENDLVVVTVVVGSAARNKDLTIVTPSGYTPLTQQNVTPTTYDTSLRTCYKFMTATPDTAVTIPTSGNNADGIAYSIQVFRGVDLTTPMDATATYATGSGTNNRPDPAAITPVTAGAWIVVCGGGAAAAGGTYTAHADYTTNFLTANGPDTNDGNVGSGYYTGWASGAYDPGAMTGGSVNVANSWAATTIALRPAIEAQALTQSSRFDSGTNAFYAAQVDLALPQASRFDNSNTYYAHTVTTGPVTITQASRFDNTNTYYAHTLSQSGANQDLTQSARFDNSAAFYAAQVNLGVTQASRFDNTPAFYAAQVNFGLTQASRFDNTPAFYAAQINLALAQATRFDNSNAFYAAQVDLALTQSARFDSSNSFYAHTVTTGPVTVTQSARFDNDNTYYAHTVTLVGGPQSLTQDSRFDNSNSFYAQTVTTGPVTITQASRFDNSNSFYAHTVTPGPVSLTQTSRFDNSAAFYAATVSSFNELLPPLLANTNAFYSPTVTPGAVTLTADLYSNAQTFYGAVVSDGIVYSNKGRDRLGSTPANNPDARLGSASLIRPDQTTTLHRRTSRLGSTSL